MLAAAWTEAARAPDAAALASRLAELHAEEAPVHDALAATLGIRLQTGP